MNTEQRNRQGWCEDRNSPGLLSMVRSLSYLKGKAVYWDRVERTTAPSFAGPYEIYIAGNLEMI